MLKEVTGSSIWVEDQYRSVPEELCEWLSFGKKMLLDPGRG